MFSVRITVDASEAQAMLAGMKGRARNFKPIFWIAREQLELANAENFTTSGLPVGGWKPRERPQTWPIMRKSGELFRSLSSLHGPPNEIGAKSATFGTNVSYAKFHQDGTSRMAKRQIVFEPPLFAKTLGKLAAEYVAEGILP